MDSGADTGGGASGALAPPFPKVGGSTVCARAASRNYNWTIYSRNSLIRTLGPHSVQISEKFGFPKA